MTVCGEYLLLGNPAVTAAKEGANLVITLQGGARVVLADVTNAPGGELGVHLYETPPATTECFGHESRRWRALRTWDSALCPEGTVFPSGARAGNSSSLTTPINNRLWRHAA